MAIILLTIGLLLSLTLGAYLVRNKTSQIKKLIAESRVNERRLREELLLLQNKISPVMEDPLTHLIAWSVFQDRLNQSVVEAERYGFIVGVMYIDISEFRLVNSTLGSDVGDQILKEVAERLQSSVRKVDSVSRVAKDTFVILLYQLAKPETAAIVAERILMSFNQSIHVGNHELNLMAYVGIAVYPADARVASDLLMNAEQALLTAKKEKKYGYRFFQGSMLEESQREMSLYNSIGHEEVFKELVVYFNPTMNVTNNSIHCLDSLLYWNNPERGMIPPHELLGLAERHRKLNAFSEWQLRKACKQYLYWCQHGFAPPYLGVAVSVKQLESSQFVYRISQILRELAFDPAHLLIEIRENGHPISFDVLEKAFNMLHYLGVKIAIDHFGSGSFSLLQLSRYPISYVRLDESQLSDIGINQRTAMMFKSLLLLAKELSVQVIVQGVETSEQFTQLKDLGCELMQGHYLSVPLTEGEVESKMTSQAET